MTPPKETRGAPRKFELSLAETTVVGAATPLIDSHLQHLSRRFQSLGLTCDTQVKQTPRGLSTFLAVMGQRGLLFLVDVTLADGRLASGRPGAAIDVWLLDACGEVIAPCTPTPAIGAARYQTLDELLANQAKLSRSMTSVYVLALAHFGLLPTSDRGAQPLAP